MRRPQRHHSHEFLSRSAKEGGKNPITEKLIELSPGPPGCQVLYNCKTNVKLKETSVSMGVVHSGKVSLAGSCVYGIEPVAASAAMGCKGNVTFGGELYLVYDPAAPILYRPGSTPASMPVNRKPTC